MCHKWRSNDIWFLKYKEPQIEIFVILGHFLPFNPLATWKIKTLKLEKAPGHIILLISNINVNHVMYGSWDMEINRQNFLAFWTVFCTFTPYGHHFTHVYYKWQSYDAWFLRYDVWMTDFLLFWTIFLHFHPSNNPKYQNFEKILKTLIYHFTHVYNKLQSYDALFLRYGVWQIIFSFFQNFDFLGP